MFLTFLLKKFGHLRQFYGSDIEFLNHLLSGEVKMSVKDALNFHDEMLSDQATVSQFMQDINNDIIGVQVSGLSQHDCQYTKNPTDLRYEFTCNFSLRGYNTTALEEAIAMAIQNVMNKPGTKLANNG